MTRSSAPRKPATLLAHGPFSPHDSGGFVNPPIIQASTVLFRSVREMRERKVQKYTYGRTGTPTSEALCDHLAEFEGADGVLLAPSGMAAISTTMLALVNAGDHVLITDSAYRPIRVFCDHVLSRLGVEVSYYDPLIGGDIIHQFRPDTSLVFVESPGSLSFEMQDLPAISSAAHARGSLVMVDNTWATPLFHKPLELGADVSVQAATKYLVGHSDAMLGTISANEPTWSRIVAQYRMMGQWCGPHDMFLTQRGLRTLEVRLKRHMDSAIEVAKALGEHPAVTNVRHPALPEDPGHAIWKRDFSGSTGLFAIDLTPGDEDAVARFLDPLSIVGLGYSWGGFESLAIYAQQQILRDHRKVEPDRPLIRLHIGLEDPGDLIADLMAGLDRYAEATGI